jgi:hypothetical protein
MFCTAEVTEGVDLYDELENEIEGINVPGEDDKDDESLERNEDQTGVQTAESNNISGGTTRSGARYKEVAAANLILHRVELTDAFSSCSWT